jgi:hypothetical protein
MMTPAVGGDKQNHLDGDGFPKYRCVRRREQVALAQEGRQRKRGKEHSLLTPQRRGRDSNPRWGMIPIQAR